MKKEDGKPIKPRSAKELIKFLKEMCDKSTACEKMTDLELSEAAIDVWMTYPMNSKESCVLDELIRRFRVAKGLKDGGGSKT